MPGTNRPQKYRKVVEVEAFRINDSNGEAVARWCGGRLSTNRAVPMPEDDPNPVYPTVVLVPYFNPSGNIDVATASPGDYVIKNKDGTHDVWSAQAFAEKGLEPFYHRGNARGANQSDE